MAKKKDEKSIDNSEVEQKPTPSKRELHIEQQRKEKGKK